MCPLKTNFYIVDQGFEGVYIFLVNVLCETKQNINNMYFHILTSTHNLYFGAKVRNTCIPLHTPVLLYKMRYKGYILHGKVILMN